ncbi:hypothetical protein F5878DRAFT_645857 [Lentinula raphanica]|uniref:J domain-containing protein n=1 Tax=Lentinula raphanica TaxID=153919 RepID=A0AA38U730_9AGAR|nr:hypothetical protein F5878DRAFT_645857 [Lentinula raphanica]
MDFLNPKTLGACRNTSYSAAKCSQFCGVFCPPEGTSRDEVGPLIKCMVCGCFAASHVHHPEPEKKKDDPVKSAPAESTKTYPTGSATAKTMFNSRSSSGKNFSEGVKFSTSPFRAQAEERKEAFEDLTGRPKKKKKTASKTHAGSTTSSSSSKAKAAPKPTTFDVMLMGNMSELAGDQLQRPSIQSWRAIDRLGRLQKIKLLPDATHFQICQAVHSSFDTLLPEANDQAMRFRILEVEASGPGKPPKLKVVDTVLLNIQQLLNSCIGTRPKGLQATYYPNLLYISLPEGSKDLEPEISDRAKENTGKPKRGSKSSSKDNKEPEWIESTESSETSENDKDKDEDDFAVLRTGDFDILVRTLMNMEGPVANLDKCDWWTGSSERHPSYSCYQDTQDSLSRWFKRLDEASPSSYSLVAEEIIFILRKSVLGKAQSLVELSSLDSSQWTPVEEEHFASIFSLGPGGFDLIIYQGLRKLPTALLTLVKYFRQVTPRDKWDPKEGFSEFWAALELYDDLLPEGNEFSLFASDIAKINLMSQSVTDIQDGLVNTFGHLTDSTKIKPSVLCRGRYGLRALFYRQIECVLDWYDTSRKDYGMVYKMYAQLCQALAERIVMHFTKSSSWSRTSPANSPPPHHQTQSPPRPRTSQPPHPPPPPCSQSSPHPPTGEPSRPKPRPRPPPPPSSSAPPPPPPPPPSSAAAGDSPSITAVRKFVDEVSKLGWKAFVNKLLTDYPHPVKKLSQDFEDKPYKKQYLELMLHYHPDRNIHANADWRAKTLILTQAIDHAKKAEGTRGFK